MNSLLCPSDPKAEGARKRHSVTDLKTGQLRPALPNEPLSSSADAPWQGIRVETYASTSNELKDVSSPNYVIVLKLSRGELGEWELPGESTRRVSSGPGAIFVVPARVPFSVRSRASGDILVVELEPAFVYRSAHELIARERLQVRLQLGIEDSYLQAAASALKSEMDRNYSGGRCYGESIATAMAVHVASRYAERKTNFGETRRGLAPYQLRRAIEFIHAESHRDIGLTEIAAPTGLSPFHFARMFKASTGLAPHQFLVKRRLERARDLLLTSDHAISDIALEVGFCDQSHLSAHFKRLYGITPKQFIREARQ